MKTIKNYIWMAAATMMVAALGACSSEDLVVENTKLHQDNIVTLTATLSPKDNDALTRSFTDPGDGTLNSAWAVNEEVCVQYTNNSGAGVNAKGIITSVSGGKATVTVNLVNPKEGNSDIFFHYPYDLAIGARDLGSGQKGTLDDIAAHYDDIEGSGTLSVTSGNATLPTSVTMTRNICIWKLSFNTPTTSNITSLNIKVGSIKEYTVTPSSQSTIYVAMFAASGQDVTVTATTNDGVYSASKSGRSFALRNLYKTTDLALTAITNSVNLSSLGADHTANNGDVLTGTLNPSYKVTIADGATVVLKNATIAYGADNGAPITCAGDATIVLSGTNNLSVPGGLDTPSDPNSQHMNGYPAILVGGTGKKLTITGSGTLNAIGGYVAAGIGCLNAGYTGYGANYACGVIQIDGGTINAYSGNANSLGDGAEVGIGAVCGGPSGDACEGIIINGGVVTSEGGAAGIGGAGGTTVNYITINGGEVTARSHGEGAGIGTTSNGQCGNITITGGTVNAYGALSAAGIGTGVGIDDGYGNVSSYSECGNIIISGGTITASGDEAGIGTGAMGRCGNIIISGGNITSTSLNGVGTGPGIGSGASGVCGTIAIANTITQLVAQGGSGVNPAIGAGMGTATCGTVTINGVDIAGETINDGANTIGGMTLTQTVDAYSGKIWTIVP